MPGKMPVESESVEGFACMGCDSSFKRKEHLSDHIDARHKGIMYPCPKCVKQFSRSNNVSKHIQANHETTCHICHVESVDEITNMRHIKSSHRVFKCRKCNRILGTKSHLTFHEKRGCNQAKKEVTEPIKRRGRPPIPIPKNGYFCTICDKSFTRLSQLTDHNQKRHWTKCELCDFTGKPRQRKRHMKTHKTIECNICEFVTIFPSTFVKHKEKQHKSCKQCSYIGKNPKDLAQHCHLLKKCDICNLDMTEEMLVIHYEQCIKSNARMVYRCNFCYFKATRKAFIRMHLKNIHMKEECVDYSFLQLSLKNTFEEENSLQGHNGKFPEEKESQNTKSIGSDDTIQKLSNQILTPNDDESKVENEIVSILDTLKNTEDVNEAKFTCKSRSLIIFPVEKKMKNVHERKVPTQELLPKNFPEVETCERIEQSIIEEENNGMSNQSVGDNENHNPSNKEECPECGFLTDNEELYNHHQVTDHLLCYICGFTTEYQMFIFSHMKAMHHVLDFEPEEEGVSEKVNDMFKPQAIASTCPLCFEKLESKGALERHRSNVHKGQSFTCKRCGKRFKSFNYIARHYRKDHDKDTDSKTIYYESLVK